MKKLNLNKLTIASLDAKDLEEVGGGATIINCSTPYTYFCATRTCQSRCKACYPTNPLHCTR